MSELINPTPALLSLADIAGEALSIIQRDYADINPVIGVMQGMRKMGIPADVMTIDCLANKKRILLVLHDEHPGLIQYQHTYTDQEPGNDYQTLPSEELTSEILSQWMAGYFG